MDEQEQREREEDARLISNASRAPWRSAADDATDEDPVDLVADSRGDIVAKLWPNAGCFEAFERSKADGRFIARARSRFPAVIAQRDAAEAKVRELEAEVSKVRSVTRISTLMEIADVLGCKIGVDFSDRSQAMAFEADLASLPAGTLEGK